MSEERKSVCWSIKKKVFKLTPKEAYEVAICLDPVAGLDSSQQSRQDEESCVEYILAYTNSPSFAELEDEGMVNLLHLQDKINFVKANREAVAILKGTVISQPSADDDLSVILPLMSSANANVTRAPELLVMGQTHASSENTAKTDTYGADMSKLLADVEELQRKLNQYAVAGSNKQQPVSVHHNHPRWPLGVSPLNTSHPPISHTPYMDAGELPPTTQESMIALRDLSLLHRKEFKVQYMAGR